MVSLFKKFADEWQSAKGTERLFMVGGALMLALAIVGLFLPIVPQIPFAILAAALFSKGSPRIHNWIRKNKYFGKPVKDWEDHGIVRPKLKIFSTVAMVAGAGMGHWQLEQPWPWVLDAIFFVSIVFVLTRKSRVK